MLRLPVLLPNDHKVSELIIIEEHRESCSQWSWRDIDSNKESGMVN